MRTSDTAPRILRLSMNGVTVTGYAPGAPYFPVTAESRRSRAASAAARADPDTGPTMVTPVPCDAPNGRTTTPSPAAHNATTAATADVRSGQLVYGIGTTSNGSSRS